MVKLKDLSAEYLEERINYKGNDNLIARIEEGEYFKPDILSVKVGDVEISHSANDNVFVNSIKHILEYSKKLDVDEYLEILRIVYGIFNEVLEDEITFLDKEDREQINMLYPNISYIGKVLSTIKENAATNNDKCLMGTINTGTIDATKTILEKLNYSYEVNDENGLLIYFSK